MFLGEKKKNTKKGADPLFQSKSPDIQVHYYTKLTITVYPETAGRIAFAFSSCVSQI